ncbi:MAG TPA: serine hydrolase domain-containing protein [Steroidobacteraceae bacterium]|jgi:CubicO group peptidase (beta-lactamase class C family)
MSSGGLSKDRLSRLHEVMTSHVEEGQIPGVVTLIARLDDVHVLAVGSRDLASRIPMRRDTIFRIASMTKPIAAAAALILVEEARLRLDDPIDPWLPELAGRSVLRSFDSPLEDTAPAARPITLRDLLTFRLGLGLVMGPPDTPIVRAIASGGLAPGPVPPQMTPDEYMRRVGALPLVHQPGERWLYHTGSDILGVLIERCSGQHFEAFLRERIFDPLGMRDTGFHVPDSKLDRLATGYVTDLPTRELTVSDPARGGLWSRPPEFASGGAGLTSTADDYLAFGRMMLNLGRHGSMRVLSRTAVELMTTDHLTPRQKALSPFAPGFWETNGWGFGVAVTTRRESISASPGSYGWDGGYGTSWRNDPREDLVTILLTQRQLTGPDAFDIKRDFETLTHQALDD